MSGIRDHLAYLEDHRRLAFYRQALRDVVSAGCTVADLGAGIGSLSVAAAKAGARRVYAVDSSDASRWIQGLARANGVEEQIVVVPGDSREVAIPEPVDVCLFDDFDLLDPRGSAVSTLSDARERWLKPSGSIIPETVALRVAVLSRKSTRDTDLELSPALEDALGAPERLNLGHSDHALAGPATALEDRSWLVGAAPFSTTLTLPVREAGTATDLVLWMALKNGSAEVDLGPGQPQSAYPHFALPLSRPVHCPAHQPVVVRINYKSAKAQGGHHGLWSWSLDASGTTATGSSFAGLSL